MGSALGPTPYFSLFTRAPLSFVGGGYNAYPNAGAARGPARRQWSIQSQNASIASDRADTKPLAGFVGIGRVRGHARPADIGSPWKRCRPRSKNAAREIGRDTQDFHCSGMKKVAPSHPTRMICKARRPAMAIGAIDEAQALPQAHGRLAGRCRDLNQSFRCRRNAPTIRATSPSLMPAYSGSVSVVA